MSGMIALTDLLSLSRYCVSAGLLVEFWCVIERKVLLIKNNKKEIDYCETTYLFLIPGPVLADKFFNLGEYPCATT